MEEPIRWRLAGTPTHVVADSVLSVNALESICWGPVSRQAKEPVTGPFYFLLRHLLEFTDLHSWTGLVLTSLLGAWPGEGCIDLIQFIQPSKFV